MGANFSLADLTRGAHLRTNKEGGLGTWLRNTLCGFNKKKPSEVAQLQPELNTLEYPIIRRIRINGATGQELLNEVNPSHIVTPDAREVLLIRTVTLSIQVDEIDTIELRLEILGLTRSTTLGAFLALDHLAVLSRIHAELLGNHVLGILPPEAAPVLRKAITWQPIGERILMAMDPFTVTRGLALLMLRRDECGTYGISSMPADPQVYLSPNDTFIFALLPREQSTITV